ncbi:hypothetical protein M5D96_000390, partial [Drosophila gunungcola]
ANSGQLIVRKSARRIIKYCRFFISLSAPDFDGKLLLWSGMDSADVLAGGILACKP